MSTEQTAEDPRLSRAIDVILRMQRIEDPAAIKAFMPHLVKDARLLLAAIDGPEPDWADVREAARKAGWTRHHEPVGLRPVATDLWSYYPPGERFPDVSGHGAARAHLSPRGLSIELHGPGKELRERADLINPTPAKVLTIARELGLVGLGGDSDA